MTEPLVYRVEEVAELLACSPDTVYDAVHRGELPGVLRLGRRILISKAALHQALGLDEELRAGAETGAKEGNGANPP